MNELRVHTQRRRKLQYISAVSSLPRQPVTPSKTPESLLVSPNQSAACLSLPLSPEKSPVTQSLPLKSAKISVHEDEFPVLAASVGGGKVTPLPSFETSVTIIVEEPSCNVTKLNQVTKSWRSLFEGEFKDDLLLTYTEPQFEDGDIVVKATPDDIEEGIAYWKSCLVGQFLDRGPPLFLIRKMVETQWVKLGKVEIKSGDDGLFVFRFEDEWKCSMALGQFWHVGNKPLFLRRWKPFAQWEKVKSPVIPIWVLLRKVPFVMWTKRGLSKIASALGVPLQVDAATEARTHLSYAKICVEVDLSKELRTTIPLDMGDGNRVQVEVEYTWKPLFCDICKNLGHKAEKCNSSHEEWRGKPPKINVNQSLQPVIEVSKQHSEPKGPAKLPPKEGWTNVVRRKPSSTIQNSVKESGRTPPIARGKVKESNSFAVFNEAETTVSEML